MVAASSSTHTEDTLLNANSLALVVATTQGMSISFIRSSKRAKFAPRKIIAFAVLS